MKARDAWQLARGGNSLMAGLGAIVGGVVLGGSPGDLHVWAAFLATAFIGAAGNILNDQTDEELDKVAHPERPLPSGRATRKGSNRLFIVCCMTGFLAAFASGGSHGNRLVLFAFANLTLLLVYERFLKKRGLPGNVLIALLVASTFPFGALAVADRVVAPQWLPVAAVALLAFLVNVARELLKDVEDMTADRGKRTTVPLQHGPLATAWGALALVAVADGAAFALANHPPPGWWAGFGSLLKGALVVIAIAGIAGLQRPAAAQRILKFGMAIALLAFLGGPLVPALLAPAG